MINIPPDLSVLNCGAGDMKFSFNADDPIECARAERCVMDMLKRGYLLFATIDGKYVRVLKFDEKTHEYIVADGPGPIAEHEPEAIATENKSAGRYKQAGRKRIASEGAAVTSIAPTSGG